MNLITCQERLKSMKYRIYHIKLIRHESILTQFICCYHPHKQSSVRTTQEPIAGSQIPTRNHDKSNLMIPLFS